MNHIVRACAGVAALVIAPWITVRFSPVVIVMAGLWSLRVWARRVEDHRRTLPLTVTVLFFIHVVFTTILFAASYLELPLLPSLQLGGGFWAFAPDANGYHLRALGIIDAIRTGQNVSVSGPAAAYGVLVAGIYVIFGSLPLNAVLVNCWFVVATALLAYMLAARVGSDVRGRYGSLFVVACWPSGFVWASQVLRDSSALFLTFAALTSIVLIVRARSIKRFAAFGATGLIATLALTAMRNYAGWLVLAAILVPLAAAIAGIFPRDRIRQTASALLLAGLAVFIGSGPRFWTEVDQNMAAANALPAAPARESAVTRARESAPAPAASFDLEATLRLVPRSFEQKRRELLKGSNATIDSDANVTTWTRLLTFLPKGTANALFAPYPWDVRVGASTGVFKLFAILETLLVIALFPALVFGVVATLKSRTAAAAVPLMFGLFMLPFVGVLIPNVGSLVRLRSQAILPLFTVAFANGGIGIYSRIIHRIRNHPRQLVGVRSCRTKGID
jgi:hypothetical protein